MFIEGQLKINNIVIPRYLAGYTERNVKRNASCYWVAFEG